MLPEGRCARPPMLVKSTSAKLLSEILITDNCDHGFSIGFFRMMLRTVAIDAPPAARAFAHSAFRNDKASLRHAKDGPFQ